MGHFILKPGLVKWMIDVGTGSLLTIHSLKNGSPKSSKIFVATLTRSVDMTNTKSINNEITNNIFGGQQPVLTFYQHKSND